MSGVHAVEIVSVFRVARDGSLQLITPSDDHAEDVLTEAVFIDIDGDGRREIISQKVATEHDSEGLLVAQRDGWLYRLKDGMYTRDPGVHILFYDEYTREKGKPVAVRDDFHTESARQARLIILNGQADGSHRCTSAIVSINGHVEADENDFRQKAARLSLPVSIAADDLIDVELRGDPGCAMSVIVEETVATP